MTKKKYIHKLTNTIWIATFHDEDKISFKRESSPDDQAGIFTQERFHCIVHADFKEVKDENN